MLRVVLDTNVIVAALRSRRGASNRLLSLIGTGRFEYALSVPLFLEYEDALLRMLDAIPYSEDEVLELIDYWGAHGIQQEIYYLWRPFLKDPRDDHVLEVAVAAGCEAIITFNERDFRGAEMFGLRVLTPRALLQELGEVQ